MAVSWILFILTLLGPGAIQVEAEPERFGSLEACRQRQDELATARPRGAVLVCERRREVDA
jgi:hypothetical protein